MFLFSEYIRKIKKLYIAASHQLVRERYYTVEHHFKEDFACTSAFQQTLSICLDGTEESVSAPEI